MNLKEALTLIEKDRKPLSSRLEQREKIEEFKQKLESSQEEGFLAKIKDRALDTGLLELISEAFDYLPLDATFVVLEPSKNYQPANLVTIRILWGPLDTRQFKAVEIDFPLDSDEISINSGDFEILERVGSVMRVGVDFAQSLSSTQWKNRDRITAGVADAIWSVGVRTAKKE